MERYNGKINLEKFYIAPILLLLLGLIWGSGYSLAHYATTHGVPPLGYAFWQSLGPAVFMLILSMRSKVSIKKISLQTWIFFFVTGLIGIALPNTNMYFAAAHLPAGILAVVVNTVPVITYLIALMSKEENFSWVRLVGVVATVTGILTLIHPATSVLLSVQTHWILSALITPFSFALCAVYVAKRRPIKTDSITLSAGMLVFSTLLILPVVLSLRQFYPLWHFPWQLRDWVIVLEIVLSSFGYVLLFQLLKMAGAVYYSLVGGVVALTGLFWGWWLFDERLGFASLLAVGLIVVGILIVSLWRVRRAASST